MLFSTTDTGGVGVDVDVYVSIHRVKRGQYVSSCLGVVVVVDVYGDRNRVWSFCFEGSVNGMFGAMFGVGIVAVGPTYVGCLSGGVVLSTAKTAVCSVSISVCRLLDGFGIVSFESSSMNTFWLGVRAMATVVTASEVLRLSIDESCQDAADEVDDSMGPDSEVGVRSMDIGIGTVLESLFRSTSTTCCGCLVLLFSSSDDAGVRSMVVIRLGASAAAAAVVFVCDLKHGSSPKGDEDVFSYSLMATAATTNYSRNRNAGSVLSARSFTKENAPLRTNLQPNPIPKQMVQN